MAENTSRDFQKFEIQVLKGEELKSGPYIYEMTAEKRGFCYIFHNQIFNDPKNNREGSEVDTRLLAQVFQQLNFEVITETVQNLTVAQIRLNLDLIKRKKLLLKSHNAFVAIFSSHGNESVIYGTDSKTIEIREIIDKFNNQNCEELRGKPKVFIFSACRGATLDEGVDIESEEDDEVHKDSIVLKRRPTYEDIFICYSTIFGFQSLRDISGTWFGSILAKIMTKHAKDHDLEFILKLVAEKIRRKIGELYDKDTETYIKVMQSICWEARGWRKQLYFNPGFPKK